mmetsp:Transcript_16267/g.23963  ORF Transcript_16267/g.23963 Transcript_16267/m.23963 type:complete len:188 (-) Transcript_16267:200-763(-)|eukprot:CAMPEP_0116040560 /NCGR_PEP_ID=MMETSP0321-20121206/24440_1 /TAXON_ID=163516 /ORGANISM="Leptocylindrus danicus var. danicus, Strain B650" /LENGTH=187 /DNA_ID=CAMNT_0003520415 /DNA_START=75 /DNA_END=638 /DNA_ORIENTATION=+
MSPTNDDLVAALYPSIPLLLYGSGTSSESSQDSDVVQTLAEVTTDYIADLCESAMRNHEGMVGFYGEYGENVDHTDNEGFSGGGLIIPLDFGVDLNHMDEPSAKDSTDKDGEGETLSKRINLKMGPQSFICSVMHDKVQYGKVKDIQASRRALTHDLLDKVIMDTIKDEVGDEGTWPGTERILPLQG